MASSPRRASGNVEGIGLDVLQAPKPEPRIMRYELTDFEWAAIRSFLPNKPRGIPRVDDRRVLNGTFWVLRSLRLRALAAGQMGPHDHSMEATLRSGGGILFEKFNCIADG